MQHHYTYYVSNLNNLHSSSTPGTETVLDYDMTVIPWPIFGASEESGVVWVIAVIDCSKRQLRWYSGLDGTEVNNAFEMMQWLVNLGRRPKHSSYRKWPEVRIKTCLPMNHNHESSIVCLGMNALCVCLGLPVHLWGKEFIERSTDYPEGRISSYHITNVKRRMYEASIDERHIGRTLDWIPKPDKCMDPLCCLCSCDGCEYMRRKNISNHRKRTITLSDDEE